MVSLVALISSGKGTWGGVLSLINSNKWDKIYLVCDEFSYNNFNIELNNVLKVKINENEVDKSLRILSKFFKEQIKDLEVGLNLLSGSGMEHMIVTSSLLKAGLGIRFIYFDKGDLKEFEILEGNFEEDDLFF